MGIFDFITDPIGGLVNKVIGRQSADDMRKQNQMISDQMEAYKRQTEITRKATEDARAQQDVEQRRVQQKQIRSLRSNYRAQGAGMLGNGQPASDDMNTKLGGQ